MLSPRADADLTRHHWAFITVIRWALAAAVALAVAPAARAQVDMWGTDGGPGTPPTTYTSQSAFGVTTGTNALQATTPQGGFWGPSTGNLLNQGFLSAMQNATTISFDLTLIGTQINGGANFAGFAQSNEMAVQLFSNSGGSLPSGISLFVQKNFAAANGTDTSGQSATWSGVDGTRTITYDLTQFTATDPTTGSTETIGQILMNHPDIQDGKIDFVEQVGGGTAPNANFFFDNVRLLDAGGNNLATIGDFEAVPEPSTFALAGLAVPALIGMVRRRRKLRNSAQTAATPAAP
jgi:hypothetical protein